MGSPTWVAGLITGVFLVNSIVALTVGQPVFAALFFVCFALCSEATVAMFITDKMCDDYDRLHEE